MCTLLGNRKEVTGGTATGAVVKLNAEIADETLKKTVEDKDYQVVSVK